MARRSNASEPNDSDRVEGFAHPRETFALLGQDVALARAARALRAGRPPSAWLITGPPGIGKATLAYRIARYLLAYGATDAGPEDLSVPHDNSVARQVAAQSHPGLLVLKRGHQPQDRQADDRIVGGRSPKTGGFLRHDIGRGRLAGRHCRYRRRHERQCRQRAAQDAGRAAGQRHAAAAVQHAGAACCPPSARAASGWNCGRWTTPCWKRR